MEPRILIIEDDPRLTQMIGLQLKQAGYRVLSAENGFKGLQVARAESPDLILLDLMLPGIDGFEVLEQLRGDPENRDLPVVVISAKSGQADVETANRIGADGYLVKPFRTAELLAVLRPLLDERQQEPGFLGTGVVFAPARGREATPVALNAGLSLAQRGEAVTLVDLHPFSVEHPLLLQASPPEEPVALSDPEMARSLRQQAWRHLSGLRLLNNLEGTGQAGQLVPDDVPLVFDALLGEPGFVLADVPVYPAAVLHRAAAACGPVLLVTAGDPVSLGAARSALKMIERVGMDVEQIRLVLCGGQGVVDGAELGYPIVAQIPAGAGADDPALDQLAGWLQTLS